MFDADGRLDLTQTEVTCLDVVAGNATVAISGVRADESESEQLSIPIRVLGIAPSFSELGACEMQSNKVRLNWDNNDGYLNVLVFRSDRNEPLQTLSGTSTSYVDNLAQQEIYGEFIYTLSATTGLGEQDVTPPSDSCSVIRFLVEPVIDLGCVELSTAVQLGWDNPEDEEYDSISIRRNGFEIAGDLDGC